MLYKLWILILICGVCCGPIVSGYILAYSSPTIRDLTGLITVVQISTFASVVNIGGVIGSLIVGYIMDRWGRRGCFLISTIPAIVGWAILIYCGSLGTNVFKFVILLYASRIFGGIFAGMCMASVTVYLVEMAPTSLRGTVAALNQLGITGGIFLAYMFGKNMPFGSSAFVALIFTLVFLLTALIIPESPRWLVKKNRLASAKQVLRRIYSDNKNVEDMMNELTGTTVDNESKVTADIVPISHMFRGRYLSKSCLIVQLMMLQQFTGINTFISYADIIFLSLLKGYSLVNNFSMAFGLFQLVFTAVSIIFLDRFGRKTFLKLASIIMGVSLFLMVISYKSNIGNLLILVMITYIFGFSIGWGPVPVILSTEMVPQEARSSAGSIAVLTSWIGSYVVTSTFPFVNYVVGDGIIFIIFGLFCSYAFVFIHRKLPETKGMSLDSMIV